jgi:hypothetical protein
MHIADSEGDAAASPEETIAASTDPLHVTQCEKNQIWEYRFSAVTFSMP